MSKKQFMYDYQLEAVKNMQNGCILNGRSWFWKI